MTQEQYQRECREYQEQALREAGQTVADSLRHEAAVWAQSYDTQDQLKSITYRLPDFLNGDTLEVTVRRVRT